MLNCKTGSDRFACHLRVRDVHRRVLLGIALRAGLNVYAFMVWAHGLANAFPARSLRRFLFAGRSLRHDVVHQSA